MRNSTAFFEAFFFDIVFGFPCKASVVCLDTVARLDKTTLPRSCTQRPSHVYI